MRNVTNLFLSVLVTSAAIVASSTSALAAEAKSEVVSLRRLTQEEYRNSIADIFGPDIQLRGTFEPTIRMGGLQATSTGVLSVTPSGFKSYTKMADSIAAQVTAEKYHSKLPCAPESVTAPDDVCMAKVLSYYGELLFRRPLTPNEIKNGVSLGHTLAKSSNDFYAGLRYSLATLIQAPDFLFRKEEAVPQDKNQYVLEPFSRATRLSYLCGIPHQTVNFSPLPRVGIGHASRPRQGGHPLDGVAAA